MKARLPGLSPPPDCRRHAGEVFRGPAGQGAAAVTARLAFPEAWVYIAAFLPIPRCNRSRIRRDTPVAG